MSISDSGHFDLWLEVVSRHWQGALTLGLLLWAVGFLLWHGARIWSPRRGGCSGCAGCARQDSAGPLVQLNRNSLP